MDPEESHLREPFPVVLPHLIPQYLWIGCDSLEFILGEVAQFLDELLVLPLAVDVLYRFLPPEGRRRAGPTRRNQSWDARVSRGESCLP